MIIISRIPGKETRFEERGFQERNLNDLLRILSKKEATDALTALGKTERDTWTLINESVQGLNEFVKFGGTVEVIESFKTHVTETLMTAIEGQLQPLKNEIDTIIGDALKPVLDGVGKIANELAQFIGGSTSGAFIGAMIGIVAGQFLPGGALWAVVGALIGAMIENIIAGFLDPRKGFFPPEMRELIEKGYTLEDILAGRWGQWSDTTPTPGWEAKMKEFEFL